MLLLSNPQCALILAPLTPILRLGSPVLRQCLSYRGVIPIMPTNDLAGSIELLAYAIGYAKANGLVAAGDRVIVSQCPRKDSSDVMEEVGVVSIVQVSE